MKLISVLPLSPASLSTYTLSPLSPFLSLALSVNFLFRFLKTIGAWFIRFEFWNDGSLTATTLWSSVYLCSMQCLFSYFLLLHHLLRLSLYLCHHVLPLSISVYVCEFQFLLLCVFTNVCSLLSLSLFLFLYFISVVLSRLLISLFPSLFCCELLFFEPVILFLYLNVYCLVLATLYFIYVVLSLLVISLSISVSMRVSVLTHYFLRVWVVLSLLPHLLSFSPHQSVSHHPIVTASHCHSVTFTPPHCHSVTLSHRHIVTPPHCPTYRPFNH